MSLPECDIVLAGRYHLQGRIASGGMGEVWRAADTVLERPVAVKLLRSEYSGDADTLARFRAEARHAAAVSHPGIAHVYDYGEGGPDGSPFLVMELVDGPALTELLARGPLDIVQALDVVAQAAAALAAAHAAGLVHRDIKPGNLLVTPGGTVKITDFGIAYAAGSAPLTRTGALIGTPAYLAPERIVGAAATAASDLYSLGIVEYECLAGTPPFTGTPMQIVLAHQRRALPPLPPGVPDPVAAFVSELTARDPADRPGSAAEVAARARYLQASVTGGRWPATSARPLAAVALGSRALPAGTAPSANPPAAVADHPVLADAAATVSDAAAAAAWQGAGDRGAPAPSGPPTALPHTEVLRPDLVLWPSRSPRRRAFLRRPLVLAAIIVALIAGMGGWLLASSLGGTSSPGSQASSPPTPRGTVDVNRSALIGLPVQAAEQQLRQLGLSVSVTWVPSRREAPGTVLGVRPSGRIAAGTPVILTAAATPRHHHDHTGDTGDTGDGQDGG
jgi:serine/threonine-protein kinase